MSEVTYEDGTAVPKGLLTELPLLNDGDLVVVVRKDGTKKAEVVSYIKNEIGVAWMLGDTVLMSVQYAPFKIAVQDKSILALVNFSMVESIYSAA